MNRESEEVKTNALKEAKRLHAKAQDTGDPELYEQAAQMYEVAGLTNKAADCRMFADVARGVE